MTQARSIAVLGTGLMGGPMARNLARAGHEVRVWNRTADKAVALARDEVGITAPASVVEAVEGAEVVLTMLLDAAAVETALGDALQHTAPGVLWLQMSTVGVQGEARLADLARRHAARYIDAPVLGTRAPAERGELLVLASGPERDREQCQVLFAPLSRRVVWLGPAGQGSRLKMVANSWVLALTAAMGEAVALAQGLNLDPEVFLDLIENHPTDSPYARTKAAAMMRRDFPPSFPVRGALKDARLVAQAMRDAGVGARVGQAVHDQFAVAMQMGHGDEDMAAVYCAAAGDGRTA
jgi:3-hydroxyisobutyrate dehydrogenase